MLPLPPFRACASPRSNPEKEGSKNVEIFLQKYVDHIFLKNKCWI
jgi:hypothetical protein